MGLFNNRVTMRRHRTGTAIQARLGAFGQRTLTRSDRRLLAWNSYIPQFLCAINGSDGIVATGLHRSRA